MLNFDRQHSRATSPRILSPSFLFFLLRNFQMHDEISQAVANHDETINFQMKEQSFIANVSCHDFFIIFRVSTQNWLKFFVDFKLRISCNYSCCSLCFSRLNFTFYPLFSITFHFSSQFYLRIKTDPNTT